MAAALAHLEGRYGLGSPGEPGGPGGPGGAWLDLGSGDGGPTLAAGLLRPWAACAGVEVRTSLHARARGLAAAYDRARAGASGTSGEPGGVEWPARAVARLDFENADMRRRFAEEVGRMRHGRGCPSDRVWASGGQECFIDLTSALH